MSTSGTRTLSSSPEDLRRILSSARIIGMVGASPDPFRPSHAIMRYLQGAGYRVIPVNPSHAGQTLHGERIIGSLDEAPAPVDLVNVFRRADAAGEVVDAAVKAQAAAVWMQLGVRHVAGAE